MTTFSCKKCGCVDLFTKENGNQTGLYCYDCGSWIKWIGKEEQRLIELQMIRNKAVPEEIEPKLDLSQVDTDDLLNELKRRIHI